MEVVIQCVYSDKLATVSDIHAVLAYIGHTVSKTGEVIDGSKKEGGIKCKLR